jgi:cellulose synthase/poly-beta-1,6-N-acetylglucosamine synthase-like glycosyltransferase
MSKPLVSGVIPTYNHGHCIANAIDSILTQEGAGELFDIETVVADDASTDGTEEVVRRFPGVRYLRLPRRQGVAAAQNAGIRQSTGKFISILGADDTWLAHKLRVQVPLLTANPQVGVLYGQVIQRSGGTDQLGPEVSRAPSGWVFEPMLRESFASHFASMLIRREAFDQAGYFDETLTTHEDYDLSLRLAFHFQFRFEPGPVTVYNLSPRGLWLSSTASGAGAKNHARVIEKALAMLPDSAANRKLRDEVPVRVAFGASTPFVLVGEFTHAWNVMLDALRTFPSSVQRPWVRQHIRWIAGKKLSRAASPLPEVRELCAQIEHATRKNPRSDRHYIRLVLSDMWAEIVVLKAATVRLDARAYAGLRALTYAPSNLARVRYLGRVLKR